MESAVLKGAECSFDDSLESQKTCVTPFVIWETGASRGSPLHYRLEGQLHLV